MWCRILTKCNAARASPQLRSKTISDVLFKKPITAEYGRYLSGPKMASTWGYKAGTVTPEQWNTLYPIADGEHQSPIDIVEDDTSKEKKCGNLVLNYNKDDITYVVNNGFSVTFFAEGENSVISGSFLEGEHRLLQFHFHWGANDCRGSEHTLNGKEYAAELHLVHLNTKYPSFEEALKHSDGLCVIGAFMEAADNDVTDGYDRLSELMENVKYKDQKYTFEGGFDPMSILPTDLTTFTNYNGSLTTPPLSECVQWVNLLQPVKVSRKNLTAFRSLCSNEKGSDNEELVDNYRPVQPRHSRSLFYHN